MVEQVDVVVIGMGPGGEDIGGRLAEAGLSVVGVESALVGGECPYWGCIPSKMMIRAANLLQEARRIDGIAGSASVTSDWAPVAERIRTQATDNWDDTVAVDRFVGKGGRFVRGRGRFTGPRQVTVGEEVFEAERGVVIATGTVPAVPPIAGLADVPYWTNHEAIEAETVPESLIVLGAGAIGAELAQVFSRFGVDVTVVELFDRVLAFEEPEAGDAVGAAFEAEGIGVRVGARAVAVRFEGGQTIVELEGGETLSAERLLVATGRATDLAGLGVDAAGLDPDARFVAVDERLRAADGVWAVGDITGAGLFTHVALYQSRIAAADILGEDPETTDYRAVSRVTFTDPEVGAVGLSEADARAEGRTVAIAVKPVAHTARGWLHGPGNEGLIKLVVDTDAGHLVGATSVGPHGGEVLGLLAVAVHARVPIPVLRSMIYAYPTFHKGVEDALNEVPA